MSPETGDASYGSAQSCEAEESGVFAGSIMGTAERAVACTYGLVQRCFG
jgi:hypothetical protein